jgi:hypothetical protein
MSVFSNPYLKLWTPDTLGLLVERGLVSRDDAQPYLVDQQDCPVPVRAEIAPTPKPVKVSAPRERVWRPQKTIEQRDQIVARLMDGGRPAKIAQEFPSYSEAGIKNIRRKLGLPPLDKRQTFTKPRKENTNA